MSKDFIEEENDWIYGSQKIYFLIKQFYSRDFSTGEDVQIS